uniref:DNA-3-methyladenine glycosylase 1 n=1 Tax=Nicotiana tabacum TaxID=4097 RepID=A0A1S4B7Q3_TOBAC|nr:DNA-3-methyladenine glycosylase 1-like [Nicotiana tomentosiformis]XP_016484894.1 PREDICTED: DNA-3-methyladenine glycosylase 1-like [Nicotiana tabacum]
MYNVFICSVPHSLTPPKSAESNSDSAAFKIFIHSMGEESESESQSQPNPNTTTYLTNVPRQSHSPPSKLPSRPRKFRKLSNTTDSHNNSNPRLIPRSLSSEGELESAINYLKSSDPLLIPLIQTYPLPILELSQPPFLALTKSILFQQLAFKAGSSIYSRFISLCGGECNISPDIVLGLTPQQLRQIGISARKASYLHDLARKYQNGILSDKSIVEMDDKSLFAMLTMVNGVGPWSVHMFMIFSLHRPDVLPIHDLGIRKGVKMLYGLEDLPRPSQMDQLCEKWKPYRSVASWYIWRFVEAKGANSKATVVGNSDVSLQLLLQQQHQHFLDPLNEIHNVGYVSFCF